jgi:hypothetical protein
MSKQLSIVTSIILIMVGLLTLAFSLVGPVLGFRIWQLWPLIVVAAGALFVLPPLLVRGKRGLGGLFIPGMPILTTGTILLFASVFRTWDAWSWLWPQEVLAVALGFLFAAIYMRNVWLLIPAIIIGANGVLMQFCAITGLWSVWAVLWAIEPLSVGLALLAVYVKRRSAGLLVAGLTLCALAVLGAVESVAIVSLSALFPVWWLWKWVGPVSVILVGVGLLVWSLVRRPPALRVSARS